MTIDEAIEIYEIRANTHEREAEYHRPLGYSHEAIANVAEMDAREERQIAKWLKELKERRAEQTEPQYDLGAYSDRLWKIAYERGKREALEQTEPQTETSTNAEKLQLKDEPQTYITEDRDTQILDAWQVHHRSTTSVEDEPQTDCYDCVHWDYLHSVCCHQNGCKFHERTKMVERSE